MRFKFTEQEANLILQSLAKQPFEVVYLLVAKVQKQASEQLVPKIKKVRKDADQN